MNGSDCCAKGKNWDASVELCIPIPIPIPPPIIEKMSLYNESTNPPCMGCYKSKSKSKSYCSCIEKKIIKLSVLKNLYNYIYSVRIECNKSEWYRLI